MSSPGPLVAIATCAEARQVDEDGPLLLDALSAVGVEAHERDWDDPDVDWRAYDLVVVRSTWDYVPRRDEFVAWATRVDAITRLANPAAVIRWNTDKRYLRDLESNGAPVVPTAFLEPGDNSHRLTGALRALGDPAEGFVVKPAVSAGSKDTVRYRSPAADGSALDVATEHLAALLGAGRTVMVQPYLSAVDTSGETGLVFFDGELSHAFRKGPLLSLDGGAVEGLFAPEVIDPREPTRAEREVADRVLESARAVTGLTPLYARVDLVPDGDGEPVLLELELTEPSFFLTSERGAAGRAAAAIAAAARR